MCFIQNLIFKFKITLKGLNSKLISQGVVLCVECASEGMRSKLLLSVIVSSAIQSKLLPAWIKGSDKIDQDC